mmetsp:Transcript_2127/g.2974  ORF Transcript_2127/g.2974 Transcript_2127/m.2974 type:complete len:204 (+) Transcript_2127:187-798(+)
MPRGVKIAHDCEFGTGEVDRLKIDWLGGGQRERAPHLRSFYSCLQERPCLLGSILGPAMIHSKFDRILREINTAETVPFVLGVGVGEVFVIFGPSRPLRAVLRLGALSLTFGPFDRELGIEGASVLASLTPRRLIQQFELDWWPVRVTRQHTIDCGHALPLLLLLILSLLRCCICGISDALWGSCTAFSELLGKVDRSSFLFP